MVVVGSFFGGFFPPAECLSQTAYHVLYNILLVYRLLLVMSDGIIGWPEIACLRLQASHSLWLSPSDLAGHHCSALWLSISPGPRKGSCNDPRGLPVLSPPLSRGGLWRDLEGGNPGSPPRGPVQFSGKIVGVFTSSLTTQLGLSQVFSNIVWFLVN